MIKNIVYLASVVDIDTYRELYILDKKPSFAASKYHLSFIEGLRENDCNVNVYSILPINKTYYKKRIIPKNILNQQEIKYLNRLNIPVIKNLSVFFKVFWLSVRAKKNTVYIFDVLNITIAFSMLLSRFFSRHVKVGIITDLPEYMPFSKSRLLVHVCNKCIEKLDYQVILNDLMIGKNGIENSKAIKIDGFSSGGKALIKQKKSTQMRFLYAGGLYEEYGVKALCESFLKLDNPEAELYIFGNGTYENELIEVTRLNNKIKYFGSISNDKVIEEMKKATVLINPRHSSVSFAQYSFPSKVMEYFSTGTPVAMFFLPGMEEKYKEIAFLVPENQYPDFSSFLQSLLKVNQEVLVNKGLRAHEYILANKTPMIQAMRVLNKIREGSKK